MGHDTTCHDIPPGARYAIFFRNPYERFLYVPWISLFCFLLFSIGTLFISCLLCAEDRRTTFNGTLSAILTW